MAQNYHDTNGSLIPIPSPQSDWEERMIETLADIEHQRWSGWHKYFRLNATQDNVARWDRQSNTNYELLTEREKESDRKEVRKYFPLIKSEIASARKEEREKADKELENILTLNRRNQIVREEFITKSVRKEEREKFSSPILLSSQEYSIRKQAVEEYKKELAEKLNKLNVYYRSIHSPDNSRNENEQERSIEMWRKEQVKELIK